MQIRNNQKENNIADNADEVYLTLILPSGCNLACPFCILTKRKERDPSVGENREAYGKISDEHKQKYLIFVNDILKVGKVQRLALQGDEPLNRNVIELTKEIAEMGKFYGVELEMVTNGTYLEENAEFVAENFTTVGVSIDSADNFIESKLRPIALQSEHNLGTSLERAKTGIKTLREFGFPKKGQFLGITSVLFPGKSHFLHGMPDLLRELGVENWTISPYVGETGNYTDSGTEIVDTYRKFLKIVEEGNYDVRFELPDDLRHILGQENLLEEAARIKQAFDSYTTDQVVEERGSKEYVRDLGARGKTLIMRVLPDLRVLVQEGIVNEEAVNAKKWGGANTPSDFSEELFAEKGYGFPRRSRVEKFLKSTLNPYAKLPDVFCEEKEK